MRDGCASWSQSVPTPVPASEHISSLLAQGTELQDLWNIDVANSARRLVSVSSSASASCLGSKVGESLAPTRRPKHDTGKALESLPDQFDALSAQGLKVPPGLDRIRVRETRKWSMIASAFRVGRRLLPEPCVDLLALDVQANRRVIAGQISTGF